MSKEAIRQRLSNRLFHLYEENRPEEIAKENWLIRFLSITMRIKNFVKDLPVVGPWARRTYNAIRDRRRWHA
ncbi:MAG: hypothetical protein H6R26_1433 [Proteobacteria bacterium]|nr:hypothetical protein [Pseudomonadota bacterium]